MASAMTTRPVRPRAAASLVLLRTGGSGPEVLLGRRTARARFMPALYVFPGGRVGPDDRTPWPGEIASISLLPLSLLRAALREIFEETGLLVGHRATGAAPSDERQHEIAQAYAQAQLAAGLDRLRYIGRAITPSSSPMRFDTRFFLAEADHAFGELRGSGELEDLHWRPIGATGELPMANVSRFMLNRAVTVRDGTADPVVPLYHWVRGITRIVPDR